MGKLTKSLRNQLRDSSSVVRLLQRTAFSNSEVGMQISAHCLQFLLRSFLRWCSSFQRASSPLPGPTIRSRRMASSPVDSSTERLFLAGWRRFPDGR